MAVANYEAINRKAEAYMRSKAGKRKISEAVGYGNKSRVSFSWLSMRMPSGYYPDAAAKCFIEILRSEIETCGETGRSYKEGKLGETAINALKELSYGPIEEYARGDIIYYRVPINFAEDLARQSLAPQYFPEGINNIAALLNNGYPAREGRKSIHGVWHGTRISGLTERAGANFIGNAVARFMGTEAKKYGVVDIKVDDIYNSVY